MSIQKGDSVTWTSQASGFTKTKVGTILAIVRPYEDAYGHIPLDDRHTSRVKGQRTSKLERALVIVPRINDYYIPRLRALRKVQSIEC